MNEYVGQALISFTYDDGRRNNYETALPLHEKYSIPSTFAIISGRVSNPKWWARHMSPFEVVDARARGVELSSHSMSHEEPLTALDNNALHDEIAVSKQSLSGYVSRDETIRSFCVPFSKMDNRVMSKASSQYEFVRVAGRKLNSPLSESSVVFSHPITKSTTVEEVKQWIDEAISQKKWLVLMFHGVISGSEVNGKYDTSAGLLESVLEYVAGIDRKGLLPVSFSDVHHIRRFARRDKASSLVESARPSEHTLAESEGYLITYHRNASRSSRLVISFGGLPSRKTTTGFGSKFILKEGWDHIFVAQAPMSQYQGLSVEHFSEAVSPVADGMDVFAYGSSLGAYAALYFGGAVNARIIAAAPKNSAHPLVLQKRFAHLEFMHHELVDVPLASNEPIVLFDPNRRDETRFIEKLVMPAYPTAHYIELPFAGHTILDTMKQAGELGPFMRAYINNHELMKITIPGPGSRVYHAERGRKLFLAKEYGAALSEFQESLHNGYSKDAAAGAIKVMVRTGRREEARSWITEYESRIGSKRGIPDWVFEELGDQ